LIWKSVMIRVFNSDYKLILYKWRFISIYIDAWSIDSFLLCNPRIELPILFQSDTLNLEILAHFLRMCQSMVLALDFLFLLLIHIFLQYLYSWVYTHSFQEVPLRNCLEWSDSSVRLCKLSKGPKVHISWKITFSRNLPKIRLRNKFMLLDCSDAVWKSALCTIVNIQYSSFCMKQKFCHCVHCNQAFMTNFNSISNFRILNFRDKFLV